MDEIPIFSIADESILAPGQCGCTALRLRKAVNYHQNQRRNRQQDRINLIET
jgi:hypothetical protein